MTKKADNLVPCTRRPARIGRVTGEDGVVLTDVNQVFKRDQARDALTVHREKLKHVQQNVT